MDRDTKQLVPLVRPFIQEFLWIRNKDQRLVPLILNYTQDYVMNIIEYLWNKSIPVRIIILKARQEGISTLIESILFTLTIMIKYTKSIIVSYNHKSVISIYKMSDRFYQHLPEQCQPETRYYTKENMYFQSADKERNLDSEIVIDQAKNVQIARGETINNLHLTEMALMEEASEMLTSLLNSIPKLNPFTFAAIESTANGIGGTFHSEWKSGIELSKIKGMDKLDLINKYIKIFIPWYWHKEYQLNPPKYFVLDTERRYGEEKSYKKKYKLNDSQMFWRRITIDGPECRKDLETFRQEYPANQEEAFIASGRTKFAKDVLEEMMNQTRDPIETGYLKLIKDRDKIMKSPIIEFIHNPGENLDIWEWPQKYRIVEYKDKDDRIVSRKKFNVHYVIGVDVAEGKIVEGKKTDRSVATVIRRDTMEQVARWKGYITPSIFADVLYLLGYWYNFAWMGIEKNNHGISVIDHLQKRYGMLYYRLIIHEKTLRKTKEYGWYTGQKERPIMLDDLETLILERALKINSEQTIAEFMSFIIYPNGKPEAAKGEWDDEVFSIAITNQMHKLMPQVDHASRPPVMSSYSMRY